MEKRVPSEIFVLNTRLFFFGYVCFGRLRLVFTGDGVRVGVVVGVIRELMT